MPKIVDHEARRAEIRRAAAEAIADLGLERVRLVDVAHRAGCTTGAVGHYFSGKEAVLAAALEHVLDGLVSSALGAMELQPGDDPAERLLSGLAEVLPLDESRHREWRVWIAFCGRAVHTPALARLHREAYAEIQAGLARELVARDLAAAGAPAERLAGALMAGLDGIGLRATLEPEAWSAARQRELLRLQLLPLLRLPPDEREIAPSPTPSLETTP